MGAGCSSPLRRLGGKKGKTPRRESSPIEGLEGGGGGGDNQGQTGETAGGNLKVQQSSGGGQHKSFILENEITFQSEINDDHPSTGSYYTDGKNHNEETKVSDHSTTIDQRSTSGIGGPTKATANTTGSNLVAKMMGLNGSFVPHDRHLLVSPALSPAPSSICCSPLPASSTLGCANSIEDLNEAFKAITFGLPDQPNQRIKLPERQPTELHNLYTHHLVQTQSDLVKYITVIFITTDTFQFDSTTTTAGQTNPPSDCDYSQQTNINNETKNNKNSNNTNIDILTNSIESSLKAFCDEHLFYLKFLNLSHEHLSEHFHINNLLETSMKILEKEHQENSQRLIIIILSNNYNINLNGNDNLPETDTTTSTTNRDPSNKQNQSLDKRQLPTRIDAQIMLKLQQSLDTSNLGPKAKDLLKIWYNQVGGIFYLNPIYLVYPKILSESKEERDQAWRSWLDESNVLIKAIKNSQETESEILSSEIKLKTLFGSYMEFIMREPTLQKRTLLIRNYSHQLNSNLLLNQQQTPPMVQAAAATVTNRGDGSLNELARLLADSNKLSIKRSMNEEEFNKTISGWISENFNKFVESIMENRVIYGKHVPSFVERNLFTELTCQRQHLEYYLGNTTENFEAKCQTFFTSQISPLLNEILNHNNSNNNNNSDNTSSTSDQPSQQQQHHHHQLSTNHLVFISGPKGCGKSTLFAQIIRLAVQELFNKAQMIYRFCGVTLDSLSSNRLLRSICEQFCQTQGENITAASYIYSSRKLIMNALNKIIKSQTSIIFLDGLDMFDQSAEADLDWLCEIEANPNIKIFITLETDSKLYKKVLVSYSDATYISLDHPSIAEWAQMLTSTARSRRFNSAGNLYDEVKKLEIPDSNETQLTYRDFSDIIHMCRIRQLNNEFVYPELTPKVIQSNLGQNFKTIQQTILTHLQYLMTPYELCALLIALGSSRNGLSEPDIISIMNFISQSSKTSGLFREEKFSLALLNYIQYQLQPWLINIISDKLIKVSVERNFMANVIEQYAPAMYPNIVTEIREMLLDYFSRQTRTRSSKGSNILKNVGGDNNPVELKENISSSERFWLATQASEVANLLLLTNPAKAKDYIMNKNQFFLQFLYGSMPEEFVEDYDKLKEVASRKPSISEELQFIVNCIRQSIYPLRYDGIQIYSQIYCRAYETIKGGKFSKSKKLNDILNIAFCPPIRNLLPISETSVNSFIKTRIGQINTTSASSSSPSTLNAPPPTTGGGGGQKNALGAAKTQSSSSSNPNSQSTATAAGQALTRQRIYTIKDNHRHVIVIYPDRGNLSVWDIYEEKAVRTISNMDQPRDLKMIDHKRAVILCNRELRVYDLDSGLMLTKLKGVMNQKMPFFEVFGENYVVALARNRMYVNMLNLNTGELETTFKVGEDRFLNSLLVSANGGICVCGDETQKPFPLLVWNLNERRLLYDLRLDRHEFLTRMSALSDDGHFVVSVCKQIGGGGAGSGDGPGGGGSGGSSNHGSSGGAQQQKSSPNFIVIYDLNSGTLFKKWKPGLDSCAVAISLSANRTGKVINTIVDCSILVWDLATGSKKHTLRGHSSPADVIRVQNGRLFSMDSTCRDQSLRIWDIEEGYCLSVFSSDAPVSCCQISTRGDALVCAFAAETRLSTLVMCKNETVNDVVKRNKRRKSSKSLYIFDEPPSRKSSS